MKLYIGNCTKQHQLFYYDAPERGRRGPLEIRIGQQICLPEEMTKESIEAIVAHQSRFGFVHVDEMHNAAKHAGPVALCYAVDKPIDSAKIERLVQHNAGTLDERGKQLRKESGIAASVQANEFLQEARPDDALRDYTTTITEESRDKNDSSPEIAEQIKVVQNPEDAKDSVIIPPRRRK